YVVYGQMLDRWLRNSKKHSDQIVDAVTMMRELCRIRSIKEFAPSFLGHCLRNSLAFPFDEEEQRFIDGPRGANEESEFIARYSFWLRAKGYPGMADRLLLCWEDCDASPEEPPLRKSSVA